MKKRAKKKPASTRGGARVAGPGKKMGRPPVESPRVTLSARLSADVADYLRSQDNTSRTIDDAIRRTKACRKFLADRKRTG